MLLIYKNIIKILPIVRFELYNRESSFFIKSNTIVEVITILKHHFKYQFKVLTCLSGIDYPENLYRFQVCSLLPGARPKHCSCGKIGCR